MKVSVSKSLPFRRQRVPADAVAGTIQPQIAQDVHFMPTQPR